MGKGRQRHERLQSIFARACELSAEERMAYLTEACGEDEELCREVEELLALDADSVEPACVFVSPVAVQADDSTGEFLERVSQHTPPRSRYTLDGEIARGGMGAILRVWDEDLRRHLAMKVVLGKGDPVGEGGTPPVDPRTLGRFLEEAQVTGQLDHPGIVPVHELGLDAEGRVYFTMKLVKGKTLKRVFDELARGEGGWSQTRVLGLILKVCEAMAYAHAKGVIHRDIKPANIMVGGYGEVYVMDWGLAKVLGQEDGKDIRIRTEPELATSAVQSERHDQAAATPDSPLVTMDGEVVGTPAYMSPEQAAGRIDDMGPQSDVYAMGALLYQLLAGHMPFVPPGAAVDNYAVWQRVQEGPPRPLDEIAPEAPAELVAICEVAMAREIGERYPDTSALAEDLSAYVEGRVVRAYETGAWAEARKWIKRNKPLAASFAAAIILLVAGLASSLSLKAASDQNASDARAQETIAKAERANVLRLSALQELENVRAEAEQLWPARRDMVDRLDSWLARAESLVKGLHEGPEADVLSHYAELARLESKALPWTPEEREEDRRTHPLYGTIEPLTRKLAAVRRAQEIREGRASSAEFELDNSTIPGGVVAVNDLAWALVAPDRSEHGRESEGLSLAQLALERATTGLQRAIVGQTVAWSFLANGMDAEAISASEAALSAAPESHEGILEGFVAQVTGMVEAARGGSERELLAALEGELMELEAEVSQRRSWRFETTEEEWWRNELAKLVEEIEAFADGDTGLIHGISPEFGWGVERRKDWAERVETLTRTGPEAAQAWAEALASIGNRDECPKYDGLEITPQLGLLPLGRDPHSTLWEFVHLQSGTAPGRDENGALALTEDTGLILVLIPGGSFWMGAQNSPNGRNYDPSASPIERPVREVSLRAFFISKFEMTQAQWIRAAGSNVSLVGPESYQRSWNAEGSSGSLIHPVEHVTWTDCATMVPRMGLTLPTEAQWEYAARAGSSSPWWVGDDSEQLADVANLADRFARDHGGPHTWPLEPWDDGHTMHAPVGSFRANDFGLHDVHGNVWEWCRDQYGDYGRPVADGDGERMAQRVPPMHVFRGGSCTDAAVRARSATRYYEPADFQSFNLGLRTARPLER